MKEAYMRNYAKITASILTVLSLFVFCCGCRNASWDISERNASSISEVCFVWVDKNESVTIMETLSSDQLTSFIKDFSEIPHKTYWNDPPNMIYGATIQVKFMDGSYTMINHYCTAHYSNGNVDYDSQYYSKAEFEDFWVHYCSYDYSHG